MKTNVIGFFDSGVGGLTVEQEVIRLLPDYDTIYLGDSARAPYGSKSREELVACTWQGCEWLFERGAELIVIACNSASASALREIQQTKLGPHPQKRILGVIRPTVEALAQPFGRVAVFSTKATKKSGAYVHEFEKVNPAVQATGFAFPDWASWVEQGKAGTQEMTAKIEQDLRAVGFEKQAFDAVLLACTHFPYLKQDIEALTLGTGRVFDQGPLVAESLKDYLKRHPEMEERLSRRATHAYFTTGDSTLATKVAQETFGYSVAFDLVDLSLKNR